jgi:hypothetical protein
MMIYAINHLQTKPVNTSYEDNLKKKPNIVFNCLLPQFIFICTIDYRQLNKYPFVSDSWLTRSIQGSYSTVFSGFNWMNI